MDKISLEKNRLDLAYKRNLQILNALLLIGFGSLVAYFAGIFLNPSKRFQYTILFILIGVITYTSYLNINSALRKISNKIKELKER